jgi:hypothetical protein
VSEPKHEYYFLTKKEARFFRALCELIVPAGNDPTNSPGANEVGAVNYIDSTLADLSGEEQNYFRKILKLADQISTEKFSQDFADTSESNRDWVLRSLFSDPKTRERAFDLRSLVLEGFYSDYHDPWYRGVTAWELIKFGGKRISGIEKDWTFLKVWRDFEQKKRDAGK